MTTTRMRRPLACFAVALSLAIAACGQEAASEHIKRGDAYLRMLLIHGARSVLCHAKKTPQHDRLRAWALQLEKSVGHNRAAVALANKLARIAWAVWTRARAFEPMEVPEAA